MMGALIRALTNNAVENIEEALGMTDATSSAMKHAIAEWYAAWYGRVPTKTEDPCQRLPYAIVNKLCKATFGEYDSGLQHTDSAKGKYLDCVRSAFDACKTSFMTQAMIGGEAWAKPVPMPDGRLTWQIVGRDSIIILGRDASGIPSDVALCEKSVSADHHFYTLVERRTSFAGRLTIQYRLYCSDNKSTLGRRVPLASLPQYERLEDEYTFAVPIDGVGMVFLRMPITNCVDGSADGVSIYEPAMGLIHRINENELQFSREFELGRMRVVASADILRTHNGKKSLTDDVFVGLDGNEQSITSVVRGAVNGIIRIINGMISAIVGGMNAVIGLLNGFCFDVPEFAQDALGTAKVGFNIDPITAPQIPYLAQGAVIPANHEFLAVLGDQTNGTNVEAPLETIQQALAEVLAEWGGQDITIRFAASGGLEQLVRLLMPYIDKEKVRRGARLVVGGN